MLSVSGPQHTQGQQCAKSWEVHRRSQPGIVVAGALATGLSRTGAGWAASAARRAHPVRDGFYVLVG
jgi:hypothetical protein